MTPAEAKERGIRVKPLVWEFDGNRVRLDSTMAFGKGYNYDGLEMARREAVGVGAAYLIWPDSLASSVFSLYGAADGLYMQNLTEQQAVDAAQADYERRALEPLEALE